MFIQANRLYVTRRLSSVAVVLACAVAAFGQTASVSLSPSSTVKGGTVTLPLAYASNGAHASAVQWTFSFSPTDFTSVSMTDGPSASAAGKTISCNAPVSGQYICMASGLNATAIADGTIGTAAFAVSSTTTAISSAIQVLAAEATSASAQPVPAIGSGATVTISSPPAPLSSLSCSPTSVIAPGFSQCTVSLSGAAPAGGETVAIGWISTSATVSTPPSVTIAAGATSAQFTAQISAATSATSVQISASLNSMIKTATISVTPATAVAVSVSPSGVTLGPGGTKQFTATVSGTSNTGVAWSLSPSTGVISSAGLYTAPSSVSTQQTVTVRATSVADPTKYGTAAIVLNPPPPPPRTVSFWPATVAPATASASDTKAVEVGLRFSSTTGGLVTGVRFYKGSKNTGTHVGHLWSNTGSLLATVTFTNETASGWQQANFTNPVQISAGTVYVISYFAPKGSYSVNKRYAWSSLSAPPLAVSGSSPGVYAYGSASAFPKSTSNSSNYWVDVVFTPSTAVTVSVSISPSNVTLGTGGIQQFTATVSGTSNSSVAWSLSPSAGTISSTGLYTAPASLSAQQTVIVRGTSVADPTKYATAAVVVNPPISFWLPTATPVRETDSDTSSVELGLRFTSTTNGFATGVRFYKGPNNTGTHIGHLWSGSGSLLATVTFTNETASSGWQEADFATPVPIVANTVYVISYFAPNGAYSADEGFAWSSLSAPPLAVSGSSPGVYAYGSATAFPNSTWNSSNYWVDVVFTP